MELLKIQELSDIFVDACLRDASGRLLFMSCYGRDTTMQQMFASFTLPPSQGGLNQLWLTAENGQKHFVDVGNADQLEKFTGRLPKDNLFGNMVHTWVFDPRIQQPDYANRVAWLIERQSDLSPELLTQKLWDQYRELSPVPLMESWRDKLLRATRDLFVTPFEKGGANEPIGDIVAYRIQLDDSFLTMVTSMVKGHLLTLDEAIA